MSRPQSSASGDGLGHPTSLLTPSYHGVRRGRGWGSALRTAAEHMLERQTDWVYSRPMVVLDLLWNSFLLLACLVVLAVSGKETTSLPVRLWIIGYGTQCHVRIACVCLQYRGRQELRVVDLVPPAQTQDQEDTSFAKHMESVNAKFSFVWWIIGFIWVSCRESTLAEDAPDLYRICVAFLSLDVFDVFIVINWVVLLFLMCLASYICLPYMVAVLNYLMLTDTDQEKATEKDINQLPRFMFRTSGESEKDASEMMESLEGMMLECDVDNPEGHTLPAKDVTCVICFSVYEDGSELRQLPCRHLFHTGCIDRWLYINATCPICTRSILKLRTNLF